MFPEKEVTLRVTDKALEKWLKEEKNVLVMMWVVRETEPTSNWHWFLWRTDYTNQLTNYSSCQADRNLALM